MSTQHFTRVQRIHERIALIGQRKAPLTRRFSAPFVLPRWKGTDYAGEGRADAPVTDPRRKGADGCRIETIAVPFIRRKKHWLKEPHAGASHDSQ